MRLGVAGVGLIGGSIALRAARNGAHVVGWDASAEHLELARERGIVAEAVRSFDALVAAAGDVLVLAAPLDATLDHLARSGALAPPALVLDVASVKVPVARAARGLAGFVATHPLAGSEQSGPAAARADLFEGRIWTLDASAPDALRTAARDFIAALGAHPMEIENEEHDRVVALTSHLPQVVSVALGAALAPRIGDVRVRALTGTGMRSLLRLGGSSWEVWRAVLLANRVSVAQEVRGLAAILSDAAESLETGSVDALAPRFAAAADAVTRLNERVL